MRTFTRKCPYSRGLCIMIHPRLQISSIEKPSMPLLKNGRKPHSFISCSICPWRSITMPNLSISFNFIFSHRLQSELSPVDIALFMSRNSSKNNWHTLSLSVQNRTCPKLQSETWLFWLSKVAFSTLKEHL